MNITDINLKKKVVDEEDKSDKEDNEEKEKRRK
jgi:hypothetical protein